ncbi:hypothetical protein BHE86_16140 [Shigella sp. FC1655]|nr:hypothetical protein BGK50_17375 [Shigella sp. FC130]OEI94211.1 hypothetical protein BHE86_16140 [Shigella sp. FC1655]
MINKGNVSKKHADFMFYCGIFLILISIIGWFTSEKIDWLYNSVNSILAIFLTIYGFRLRKKISRNE